MNQHQSLTALAIVHVMKACAIEGGKPRFRGWTLLIDAWVRCKVSRGQDTERKNKTGCDREQPMYMKNLWSHKRLSEFFHTNPSFNVLFLRVMVRLNSTELFVHGVARKSNPSRTLAPLA
jgi:hypothetical protein